MARLTNSNRDYIIDKVIKYKFGEEGDALKKLSQETFDKVVDLIQGDLKTTIDKIPLEYFRLDDSFYISVDVGPNKRYSYYMRGAHHRPTGTMTQYSSLSVEHGVPKAAIKIATDAALKQNNYDKRKEEAERQIRALVYSVNTHKKLYEVWPELATIVPQPEDFVKETGTALTVNVAKLNALIGLPPETKKDAKAVRTKRKRAS